MANDFKMFDSFDNRVSLVGTLTALTALRIGAGRATGVTGTDLPVVRDAFGKPYIPGVPEPPDEPDELRRLLHERLSANLIRESILQPDAKTAKGYEKFKGVMPKTFGHQFTAEQLEALVQFLAGHK